MIMYWLYLMTCLTITSKAMAKVNNDEPLAKLTEESKRHMEEIKAELERAESDLDALEELGLDVSRLRERVNWGKKAREVILKRLT
jgi:uncharacterized protein YbaP (TraB family)